MNASMASPRILVIEDEFLIAIDAVDALEQADAHRVAAAVMALTGSEH